MCLRLPALLSIMLCPRLMKACRASDSWDSVTLVLLTRGVRMMRVLASFSKMSVRLGWNLAVGPEGGSCERMSSMTVVPWFSSMYRRVMVPPLSLRMSAMMVLFGCKMKAFGPSVLHLRDVACDL